jgi:hypothetical protein
MGTRILQEDEEKIVIELTVPKHSNFLEFEQQLQVRLSEAGRMVTERALEGFDADGFPFLVGNTKFTAKKEKVGKKYETPFGTVQVERFAYQSSGGGRTHIPLEQNARIIGNATPRLAKLVSSKYSHSNAGVVQEDLRETLHREVSRCFIQDLSALVAGCIGEKSPRWGEAGDEPSPAEVATIAIGLDGTSLLFCNDGYRQAMVGTISFYDAVGERLHTHYVAAAPEYGRQTFLGDMDREITRIRRGHPQARYVGISDGAPDFRPWLEKHTTTRILDFWHLAEHLSEAAGALFPTVSQREAWMEDRCHRLKHEHGAAKRLLEEIEEIHAQGAHPPGELETLGSLIGYLKNNLDRTHYASYRKSHLPIGSGVTEAACKTVVKQRMRGSGMKWKHSGAATVLRLRSKRLTKGAWEAFWARLGLLGL